MPPARAACKPRDRGAEKRGSSCHKRKYHRCTASLAYVVARLREDGIDAPLGVRPCQARLGGRECDEIVAVVRRDPRMSGTGQQNAPRLGPGISDIGVLGSSLRAEQSVEIVGDQIFASDGLRRARRRAEPRQLVHGSPGREYGQDDGDGPRNKAEGTVAKFNLIGIARDGSSHTPGEVPTGAERCDSHEDQI